MEFCKITDCPEGSRCQNLVYGYECVANVTLTGNASGLQYRLIRGEHSSALESVRIAYRTHDGGTLLHITAHDQPHKYFTISTSNDQVPMYLFMSVLPSLNNLFILVLLLFCAK